MPDAAAASRARAGGARRWRDGFAALDPSA